MEDANREDPAQTGLAQGRSRRQPVVSAGRAGARSALEALKAAREEGASKRVAQYQVKQEKAVYDVLEETEYAKLVAKRREEGGDFIVDDDGRGYADLGEEDEHWRGVQTDGEDEADDQGGSGDEGARGGHHSKKRKAGVKDKDVGKSRKKGAGGGKGATEPISGAGNIAKMFSKAAARAALNAPLRPAAQPSVVAAADSDALLADILGGIGEEWPAPGAPLLGSHAPPASLPAGVLAGGLHAAAPLVGAAVRSRAGSAAWLAVSRGLGAHAPVPSSSLAWQDATGPTLQQPLCATRRPADPTPFTRPADPGPVAAARGVGRVVGQRTATKMEVDEDGPTAPPCGDDREEDYGMVGGVGDDDNAGGAVEDQAALVEPSAGAAAASEFYKGATAVAKPMAGSSSSPDPVATAFAGTKPAAAVPAHTPGVGALVQERSQAAAAGWSSMMYNPSSTPDDEEEEDADVGEGSAAAAPSTIPTVGGDVKSDQPAVATAAAAAQEPGGGGTPAGPVPAGLPEGAVPFYYLDAYENADARPGEVFLFGKVPLQATPAPPGDAGRAAPLPGGPKWASACVVVRELQRSVLVVPRPGVFEDGDGSAALLEAQAAAAAKEAQALQAEAGRRGAEAARCAALLAAAPAPAPLPQSSVPEQEPAQPQQRQEEQHAQWHAREGEARRAAGAAAEQAQAAAARAQAARVQLLRLLHERCSELKAELRQVLARAGVRSFRLVPVKRWYAFENLDVPRGEQWCIKIRYPASLPALSMHLSGRHFLALFGAATPCIESLLIKRKIKGPCWLVLGAPQLVEYCNQVSWCKVELSLSSAKGILSDSGHPAIANRAAPPVTVASLNLKTVINPSTQQHEVVTAAVVYLQDFVGSAGAPATP